MKKISTILLGLFCVAFTAKAQIAFNEVAVEAWLGNGAHEVIFIIDFDPDPIGTDSAFAWGIRFETEFITGTEIMDMIAEADENFSYTIAGGFLDNISYTSNNQTYTNANNGWFSIIESINGADWVWNNGIDDQVGNGEWFGIVAMDPDTWEAEINVPLIEIGVEDHFATAVKIFPNPASVYFTVDLPESAEISVINSRGQMILRTYGMNETIGLANTTPGIYLVSVIGKHVCSSKKIVVK